MKRTLLDADLTQSSTESSNNQINILDNILDLPNEMLVAIPTAASVQTSNKVMSTLFKTCTTFNNLFREKLAAQQLLELVLKPTKANLDKAKKMWTANPRILFIEATAEEYAAGLDENLKNVHRIVKASPIRAMAGAGDIWLLKEVIESKEFKNYVDPVKNKTASQLAADEIKKQFPNGFDYPPSTYDYGPLLDAITNDQFENNAPSDATRALIAQFRNDFLPDNMVTSGHFFNLNELARAFELCEANSNAWLYLQASLFWKQVIGYLQRLVSGVIGEVISQGIKNACDGKAPWRGYQLIYHGGHLQYRHISYFPLQINNIEPHQPYSYYSLGLSSGITSHCTASATILSKSTHSTLFTKLMSSNSNQFEQIYATLAATTKPTCGG